MKIGGLEKLSLIDYPDHIAAIVFTQGCNFRCSFCYNPMLVLPDAGRDDRNIKEKGFSPLRLENLFLFLHERFGRLDGVVISGGEPTMHKSLPNFIRKIKDIGYDVKLDTNGTNPQMLASLVKDKLVDYIAMDLKAPIKKYEEITKVKTSCNNLKKSVKIILDSGLPHEFRTTVVPGLLTEDDILEMGKIIKGAKNWYLQVFKSDTDLVNPEFQKKPAYSKKQMEKMVDIGKKSAGVCYLRE